MSSLTVLQSLSLLWVLVSCLFISIIYSFKNYLFTVASKSFYFRSGQILQVQMNDYRYHYHMTSFDIELLDLENLKYNFVNLTAFRIVDSTNPMVKHVLKDIERFSTKGKQILNRTNVIQAGPALMFDSVYALAKGVHSLQKSAPRSMLRPSNASCETEVPWMDGSSLYNYINSVSLLCFRFLSLSN
jgi:ionotropic kainate glutamate receptor 2